MNAEYYCPVHGTHADFYEYGKRRECYICKRSRQRLYYLRNRQRQLVNIYKIDIAAHDRMFELQDGKCLVCAEMLPYKTGTNVHIDHCHVCGKVRAILHRRCNHVVGVLEKNPELVRRALQYMASHEHSTGQSA